MLTMTAAVWREKGSGASGFVIYPKSLKSSMQEFQTHSALRHYRLISDIIYA
jgi:glutaredoxin 2